MGCSMHRFLKSVPFGLGRILYLVYESAEALLDENWIRPHSIDAALPVGIA
jgi:hypothetical protein